MITVYVKLSYMFCRDGVTVPCERSRSPAPARVPRQAWCLRAAALPGTANPARVKEGLKVDVPGPTLHTAHRLGTGTVLPSHPGICTVQGGAVHCTVLRPHPRGASLPNRHHSWEATSSAEGCLDWADAPYSTYPQQVTHDSAPLATTSSIASPRGERKTPRHLQVRPQSSRAVEINVTSACLSLARRVT